jgi:hypothetical protein
LNNDNLHVLHEKEEEEEAMDRSNSMIADAKLFLLLLDWICHE